MKLYAGFDGGGTKTICVLCDEEGTVLGTGAGGPLNYLYCGRDTASASVTQALGGAFKCAGTEMRRLAAAYVSSAAIKHLRGAEHEAFFGECIDAERLKCEGDILPIWYGAYRDEPAVICIAGTGSTVYVCHGGTSTRVGGWGPQLGDEGSGYDIGIRALRTVLRMYDGRVPGDSEFMNRITEYMGVDDPRRLVSLVREGDTRSRIASAAKPVSELCAAGNAAAAEIMDAAADELCLSVAAACAQDETGGRLPLVLSGGLVREGSPLAERIRKRLPAYTGRVSGVKCAQVHPAAVSAALALVLDGRSAASEKLLSAMKGVSLC